MNSAGTGEKRQIELHSGESQPRRIFISAKVSKLMMPVRDGWQIGVTQYVASGTLTGDGIEIWVPQEPDSN